MPQFAANLSMLYPEHPFLDRFEAAARDGFQAVEYLFPYDHEPAELAARLQGHGLRQVLFNGPPGDWNAGERGLACLPGREQEFREGIVRALRYADALGCRQVHVMSGIVPAGQDRAALQPVYEANLRWAAAEAARQGVDILVEPINPRDIPGIFLNRQDHAHEVIERVGAANLKVLMDLYHCQVVEGDVAMKIRQYLPTGRVGHFQVAGVPHRKEPDTGELDYGYLFGVIEEVAAASGWDGWIGCEYRPARGSAPGGTTAGLRWREGLGARRA